MRRTENSADRAFSVTLQMFGGVVLFIVGIIALVCYRLARPALSHVGLWSFLTGRDWDPIQDNYGALPFVYGTLVTSALAVLLAVPVALGLALFLTEMAPASVRRIIAFMVDMLASIPSVIYGLWGLMVLVPLLRSTVEPFLETTLGFLPLFSGAPLGLGYLAAGILLAIMILPTISSVTMEVFRTMPREQREGALALGATRWEAIRLTVLPYARRGILGAIILGLARALGETMAVTMVIGNAPQISASLFAAGYSLPAVIANEFAEASGEIHTGALAALALVLLGVTLSLSGAARLALRSSRSNAVAT